MIERILNSPPKWFRRFGDRQPTKNGELIFRDNGAKILAVAHLDTVGHSRPILTRSKVHCPQLDDRLGVWAIIHRVGNKADWLFTDNEEWGVSTGGEFTPPKEYNWIFSFDRAGTIAAHYQYDSLAWLCALSQFKIAYGSYSCIADMDHLGCCGINWGIGYHHQHTARCFAHWGEVRICTNAALAFIAEFANTPFPHVATDPWADDYDREGGEFQQCYCCREWFPSRLLFHGMCEFCEFQHAKTF